MDVAQHISCSKTLLQTVSIAMLTIDRSFKCLFLGRVLGYLYSFLTTSKPGDHEIHVTLLSEIVCNFFVGHISVARSRLYQTVIVVLFVHTRY